MNYEGENRKRSEIFTRREVPITRELEQATSGSAASNNVLANCRLSPVTYGSIQRKARLKGTSMEAGKVATLG